MFGGRRLSFVVVLSGLILTLTGFGLTGWLGVAYLRTNEQKAKAGLDFALTETDIMASAIDAEMAAQKKVAIELATGLTNGKISFQNVKPAMEAAYQRKNNLFGIIVAFAPNVYPGANLYAPYYFHSDKGEMGFTQVETVYDYTSPEIASAEWYVKTAQAQIGLWHGIYGKASNDWLVIFATPFYYTDPATGQMALAGVVATTHSTGLTLRPFMDGFDLGKEGYPNLITSRGLVVYSPAPILVGKTLLEAARLQHDKILEGAVQRQLRGEDFYVERISIRGEPSWTLFKRMPTSGWTLAPVIYRNVKNIPASEKVRWLTQIGLAFLLGVAGLSMIVFRPDKATNFGFWTTSVAISLCFALSIGWIWYLIYTNPLENGSRLGIVYQKDIEAALSQIEESQFNKAIGRPTRIPTGIVIENLSKTNRDATVTGYTWQKYPLSFPEKEIGNPQFPDDVDYSEVSEVYRFIKNGKRVVGWFFKVTLNQNFNVSRYPLDEITIRIKMDPYRLSDNVVLVPDLENYAFIAPSQQPGLSKTINLPGWNLRTSYFTYITNNYDANFGGLVNVYKNTYPTLTYNIHATRTILSPIIAYVILLFVVLVQVFGMITIRIDNKMELLSVSSALFLVAAISHNGLRSELSATRNIYLEYFFILLYLTILASTLNAFMRTTNIKVNLLQYRDNILAQILFWPLVLAIGLIVTLITFYPQ